MNKDDRPYAIVTGASSGVGREYAVQLAYRGYNLILVSNDANGNDNISIEIKNKYKIVVYPFNLDLTLTASVDALVRFVEQENLQVDVLVCNAGVLVFGGVTSTSVLSMERIVELHCLVPTLLCRAFARKMVGHGKGYILIMSSATAWMPYPTIAAYSATKAYLKTFGRSLWYELRDRGVKVTVVFPGAIDTSFYDLSISMRQHLLWWHVMLSPAVVARKGLKALFAGRHCLVPGVFTKLCVVICRLLPAWALLPILSNKRIRKLWE